MFDANGNLLVQDVQGKLYYICIIEILWIEIFINRNNYKIQISVVLMPTENDEIFIWM